MGPLAGIRVIEIAGIGPGPFCAMLLADLGADVVRVDRLDGHGNPVERDPQHQTMHRNRRSLALDLKKPSGAATILRLCESADALIEGFRPGVMERLGLGPDACLDANAALVYGRMSGWGQDGPLAKTAGHDINYVAISGVLGMLGRADEPPSAPLNIIGDMGGGGLLLAFGIVCALLEAKQSGQGQVVDAAMVDGSALMASAVFGLRSAGLWSDRRGVNLIDGGAPFYDVYATSDGGYMAVGAIEPQFYAELIAGLGLQMSELPKQMDAGSWPAIKRKFSEIFRTRSKAEWTAVFADRDACVSPVLSLTEAAQHPHNQHRQTYVHPDGVQQAGPAPRFSRTPPEMRRPPPTPGQHGEEVLREYGFADAEIEALRLDGAI